MWKVLVIEDDPMLAEIHKRYIDDCDDFSCIAVAHNTSNARDEILKLKPDLIFLDIYLPQMNGLDFLVQLREMDIDAEVILITAARNINQVEKAYRYGAIDYLIKPFEFDRLDKALETFKARRLLSGSKQPISQENLDTAYYVRQNQKVMALPKGLHERTLERVRKTIHSFNKAVSIDDIVERMDMSKVTLRRYLEYLEKTDEIDIEMSHGSRGRPSYMYKTKKKY